MTSSKPTLTVIVPIRWSGDRHDALQRLKFLTHDLTMPETIEILVVDDGSPFSWAKEIESSCALLNFRYLRIDSELQTFSIGRARNLGAMHAKNSHIMFQDADLLPYPGFYSDVLTEMIVQKLDRYAERFLMFGVIYLTRNATQEYLDTDPALRKNQFIQYLLENDKTRIEKFSTGTSVTVWSRQYFLATGGNDPDFNGWGYEDLEYACRAIRRAKVFAIPEEFFLDFKNFQTISDYKGWKSVYRLFGDMTFKKGIVLFHAWHPIDQNGTYSKAKEKNRRLFEKKLEIFRNDGSEPTPLAMIEQGKTLIFRNNPWVNNRWIAPFLGEIVYVDEKQISSDCLIQYIKDQEVTRVLFHNPYATDKMVEFYSLVRASGISYLVCERGALPGSVFFDPNGFNGESSSYEEKYWNFPLEERQLGELCEYVRCYKANNYFLEDQSDSIGPAALRKKLDIAIGKKVLFVPLQRPSDTVIKYLAEPINGYDGFISLLREFLNSLPPHWVVVVKRHPLELESPELPGAIFCDDGNVNDLIELSDSIFLINSGVGLLGLMYEKRVFYCGTAFYGHPKLSKQVSCLRDLNNGLNCFLPDVNYIRRFVYYLVFNFYSFAKFTTRRVDWHDGTFMTATTAIEYAQVRFPGQAHVFYERRENIDIPNGSILYDRYRNSDGSIRYGTRSQRSNTGALPSGRETNISSGNKKSRVVRLWKKFMNNPVMYLRDSKNPIERWIGFAIKKN